MSDGRRSLPQSTDLTGNVTVDCEVCWSLFAPSLFSGGPNEKGRHKPSYILMDEAARQAVTSSIFETTNLINVFTRVHAIGIVDDAVWQHLFELYFPKKVELYVAHPQNWDSMPYLQLWRKIIAPLDDRDVAALRREIYEVSFKPLLWVPQANAERVWHTTTKREKKWFHSHPEQTGVHIAVWGGREAAHGVVCGSIVEAA